MFVALAGAILAWAVQQSLADDWNASTTMLVENPENARLFDRDAVASPDRYTADQVAILESTPVAERALAIAQESASPTSLTLDDFTHAVEVESGADSGLIRVTASHSEPEMATLIANSVVSAYEELKEAESARVFDESIAQFDASIQALDEELDEIAGEIESLRVPGSDGAGIDAQVQAAMEQLLELLSQEGADDAQLAPILQQLQTLQLIQAVRGDDPTLASLIESRNQALERRSQLALRRDQLRVDAALTSTGIAMVSSARDAGQAVTLPRALVVGLLLGAAVGVVVAFAYASRSRRFQHRDEPELVLHAPRLAEIPDFADLRTSIPARDAPHSTAAESFRLAEAGLDGVAGTTSGTPVVAIVSAEVGVGTIVTANLAVTAALRGKRVLAVDCNFGDPALARLLGGPSSHEGITDVVDADTRLSDAVSSVDGTGFTIEVLGKGYQNVTAPAFFRSPTTQDFFAALPDHYDLVLVDAPSPLQVAYAGDVLRLCESIVMVVPDQSEVSVLIDAIDRLTLTGVHAHGYIYSRSGMPSRLFGSLASSGDGQGLAGWNKRSPQP